MYDCMYCLGGGMGGLICLACGLAASFEYSIKHSFDTFPEREGLGTHLSCLWLASFVWGGWTMGLSYQACGFPASLRWGWFCDGYRRGRVWLIVCSGLMSGCGRTHLSRLRLGCFIDDRAIASTFDGCCILRFSVTAFFVDGEWWAGVHNVGLRFFMAPLGGSCHPQAAEGWSCNDRESG